MTKQQLDQLSFSIIGAAIEVHKHIGPGLLESAYQKCLKREFELREIEFISEFSITLSYKGFEFENDFRCDFYIENSLIIEIKAVNEIAPIHEAQLLNYMNLLKSPKGILINFNCKNIFQEGQKTYVNEFYSKLPRF